MVKCLLIDRNAPDRSEMARLVKSLGFLCLELSTAEEGVVSCQKQMPDLVLMDAANQLGTKEFLRLVSAQAPGHKAPIVMLYSDRPNLEMLAQSIIDGATDFLVKPLDRELLSFKFEQSGLMQRAA